MRKACMADCEAIADISYIVLKELYPNFPTTPEEEKIQKKALVELIGLDAVPISYKNAFVWLESEVIVGVIFAYDYSQFDVFQHNLFTYGKRHNIPFPQILKEAAADDFYIDTVAIAKTQQSKGYGQQLLDSVIEYARVAGFKHISLIVEENKGHAQYIYGKKGFVKEATIELYGGCYQYQRKYF
ncbi:hypothetical protein AwErysi_06720 [Erysipelotrichaceae bacterium]|nr:hypothetical protein AwErysi_06720 [Erysipelotrichaceae bacterium]